MLDVPTTAEKPNIESLKLSELTVAQFRQVMQECFRADRNEAPNREMAMRQALGIKEAGKPVW